MYMKVVLQFVFSRAGWFNGLPTVTETKKKVKASSGGGAQFGFRCHTGMSLMRNHAVLLIEPISF